MSYNYYEAVENDVYEYIQEYLDIFKEEYDDIEDMEETLNDTLFVTDSVTGNASGSYTFNSAEAKEYLEDNIDLGIEAYTEFGYDKSKFYEDYFENPESADVTIRCYCLGSVINKICSDYDFDDFENKPSIKM